MIKANFELYAPIKGFEGFYEVSTWGNVRSSDRIVNGNCGSKYLKRGKILKQHFIKKGYLRLNLCVNNISKKFLVHRLVAETFIPNPDNLPQVNHKDEDKTNNRVENLEWCTNDYNIHYGTALERGAKSRINGKRSKKVYQYDLQGNLIKIWDSTMETGRNGYTQGNVSACCNGKHRTHKGFIWSYKKLNKI